MEKDWLCVCEMSHLCTDWSIKPSPNGRWVPQPISYFWGAPSWDSKDIAGGEGDFVQVLPILWTMQLLAMAFQCSLMPSAFLQLWLGTSFSFLLRSYWSSPNWGPFSSFTLWGMTKETRMKTEPYPRGASPSLFPLGLQHARAYCTQHLSAF